MKVAHQFFNRTKALKFNYQEMIFLSAYQKATQLIYQLSQTLQLTLPFPFINYQRKLNLKKAIELSQQTKLMVY
jgi:hypothetical protein